MKYINNEKGIALVTSLLLTLIALTIIAGLMYFVTTGIQLSAAGKRYKNVVEAGYGGVALTVNEIVPSLNYTIFSNFSGAGSGAQTLLDSYAGHSNIDLQLNNLACLKSKLDNATVDWDTACSTANKSLNPKESPDFTFVLKHTLDTQSGFQSNPGFRVYSKIVDTPVKGNTDKTDMPNLRKGENVTDSAEIGGTGVTIPTTYRIEVRAERVANPQEKSNLSVLYAY